MLSCVVATSPGHTRVTAEVQAKQCPGEEGVTLVNCPRSYANFLDLGAFQEQFDAARHNGLSALAPSLPAAPSALQKVHSVAGIVEH